MRRGRKKRREREERKIERKCNKVRKRE